MAKLTDFILIGAIGLGAYLIYKSGILQTISGIGGVIGGAGDVVNYITSIPGQGPQIGGSVPEPLMQHWGFIPTEYGTQKPGAVPLVLMEKWGLYGKPTRKGKKGYPTKRPDTPLGRGFRVPSRPGAPTWTQGLSTKQILTRSKKLEKIPTASLYGTKKIITTKQGTSIITRSGR